MIYVIAALLLCLVLGNEKSKFLLYAFIGLCIQIALWVAGLALLFGLGAWLYSI